MPLTGFNQPGPGNMPAQGGTNALAPFANLAGNVSISPSGYSSSTQFSAAWIAILAIALVLYIMAVD